MSPLVQTEDLIDAHGVAHVLGLAQPNSVSLYQRRYPDMPRPVINLGANRPRLWLRSQIEAWAKSRPSDPAGPATAAAGSEGNAPPGGGGASGGGLGEGTPLLLKKIDSSFLPF